MLINNEEREKWTDRALMLEYGRIDSIEIEEEEYGRWIQRIRARCFPSPFPILLPRYGTDQHHQWSQWRQTGYQRDNPTIHQLELSSSYQLSGYTRDSSGLLYSICIRNLDNGEQQEVGNHEPQGDRSLIVAPPLSVESMLHLTHLSGGERRGGRGGQQLEPLVCFNLS